jgi:hypothetical protein
VSKPQDDGDEGGVQSKDRDRDKTFGDEEERVYSSGDGKAETESE